RHDTIHRRLERSGSLALADGEQLVTPVNLFAHRRQFDSVDAADYFPCERVQTDMRGARMRQVNPRVTRIEEHSRGSRHVLEGVRRNLVLPRMRPGFLLRFGPLNN